jgi:hypothetical protein
MAGRIAQARAIAAYRGIAVVPFTAAELATMRRQFASGTPQEQQAVRTVVNSLPDDMKPDLAGPSSGGPHTFGIDIEASMKALHELDGQGADDTAATPASGTRGAVQASEPPPGSPDSGEADQQVREANKPSWNDLTFLQQLGVSFERLNEDSKAHGATLSADSAARRVQQVQEFQRRQDAGEELTLVEKQYLLRNRRAASDLAQAVGRLVEARRNLDRLPTSDALRQVMSAPTAAEAGRLLREKPDEIAKALGVESVPALTLSLITSVALGPIGGGLVLTGQSGLEGYSNGLIGALAEEGVDVGDPEDLASTLQDKDLMDRVRDKATTESAIQAGTAILSMLGGGGRAKGPGRFARPGRYSDGHHWVPGPIRRLPNLSAEARRVLDELLSGMQHAFFDTVWPAFDGPKSVWIKESKGQIHLFVEATAAQDDKEWDDFDYLAGEVFKAVERLLDKEEPHLRHKIKYAIQRGAAVPKNDGYRELMSGRVFKRIAKQHAPWRLERGR